MKKYLGIICLVIIALTGCKKGSKIEQFVMPVSSGRPYEMLVVIDKAMYERPAGQVLKEVLISDVPGLPQPEPQFRISTCPPSGFDRTFKIFRNIIVVDVDEHRYTQTKLKYNRDVNSTPQMILTIQSPSESEFSDYVYNHGDQIINFFVRTELNREIVRLEKDHSNEVDLMANKMFGCNIWAPSDITAIKEGENFFWASSPTSNSLNLCMYSYPYTRSDIFTDEYFVQKRDSVMKRNIPGERDSMWMATQFYRGKYLVESKHIAVQNTFTQEVRGLWEMTKDNMGGPFISHVRVDTVNHKVIVAEGFVYLPNKPKKRDLIRKLESSLYTLLLPGEKRATEEEQIEE